MITPKEFAARWQAEVVEALEAPDEVKDQLREDLKLVTPPPERLTALRIPEDARQFLAEAGLPKSCGPFLTFEEVAQGLPRLWEVYSPGQWTARELVPMEPYLMLGSEGAGDPICLDERDGRVVLLDHEIHFREVRAFVNCSLPQLAESLLIYETVPAESRSEELRRIDPPAVEKGAFWWHETRLETQRKKPWWKLW